jgi:hypothetical protein
MWRLIESSAKMNCPQEAQALLPMMAATRGGFERLEQDLVQSMVMQAVTGVTAGLASQAQHLIDTLVRNLYERTADVGFLATDAMLCGFMAGRMATRRPSPSVCVPTAASTRSTRTFCCWMPKAWCERVRARGVRPQISHAGMR